MLSIVEYLGDIIFEWASNRRIARQNSVAHRDQILRNMIKIAIFGQESTWVHELEMKISEIQMNQLPHKKSKFLTEKEYFQLLYGEMLEPEDPWNECNTLRYIKSILKEYKDSRDLYSPLSEKITQKDIEIINSKIKSFLEKIAFLLSKGKAISKEVDDLINDYVKFWIYSELRKG